MHAYHVPLEEVVDRTKLQSTVEMMSGVSMLSSTYCLASLC